MTMDRRSFLSRLLGTAAVVAIAPVATLLDAIAPVPMDITLDSLVPCGARAWPPPAQVDAFIDFAVRSHAAMQAGEIQVVPFRNESPAIDRITLDPDGRYVEARIVDPRDFERDLLDEMIDAEPFDPFDPLDT